MCNLGAQRVLRANINQNIGSCVAERPLYTSAEFNFSAKAVVFLNAAGGPMWFNTPGIVTFQQCAKRPSLELFGNMDSADKPSQVVFVGPEMVLQRIGQVRWRGRTQQKIKSEYLGQGMEQEDNNETLYRFRQMFVNKYPLSKLKI